MKEGCKFTLPVYKDQTSAPNYGLLAAIGDTVTLVIANDDGVETTRDVVLTGVGNRGREIFWDTSTTNNLRTEDVIRVGAEHQFNCPGPQTWTIALTELNPSTVAAKVVSLSLGGVPYTINVTEAAIANGITATFISELLAAVNSLVAGIGSASAVLTGTAGTQVLTLRLTGMLQRPTGISVAGLTPGTITLVV
jgi:hypothetical protein